MLARLIAWGWHTPLTTASPPGFGGTVGVSWRPATDELGWEHNAVPKSLKIQLEKEGKRRQDFIGSEAHTDKKVLARKLAVKTGRETQKLPVCNHASNVGLAMPWTPVLQKCHAWVSESRACFSACRCGPNGYTTDMSTGTENGRPAFVGHKSLYGLGGLERLCIRHGMASVLAACWSWMGGDGVHAFGPMVFTGGTMPLEARDVQRVEAESAGHGGASVG